MSQNILPDFRDQFSTTMYPFADTAILRASGGLTLPRTVFLDASLFPVGNTGPLRLLSVTVLETEILLSIGDSSGREWATGSFSLETTSDTVALADSAGRSAGVLIIDKQQAAALGGADAGVHAFTEGAEFAASCVIPSPDATLRSLAIPGADLFTGEVWLVGGAGVVLRESADGVRLDVVGDPLYRRVLCIPAELFETPRFLKTISYQPPDRFGNVRIDVGDHIVDAPVLRIIPTESGDGLLVTTTGRTI